METKETSSITQGEADAYIAMAKLVQTIHQMASMRLEEMREAEEREQRLRAEMELLRKQRNALSKYIGTIQGEVLYRDDGSAIVEKYGGGADVVSDSGE